MTAIHETAYPRIRSNLSEQELQTLYTPTPDDLAFIERTMKSTVAAFGGVVLLKTFQRLGYFPFFDALPPRLIQHLATTMGLLLPHETLQQYEQRGFRKWHLPLIRDHLGIRAFSDGGRRVLVGAVLEASRSKDILADIINVGIEALVHARYELPAFSTLRRAAQKARAQVNHRYYHQVYDALDDLQRMTLTRLLSREEQRGDESVAAPQTGTQTTDPQTDPRASRACPVVAVLEYRAPGPGWHSRNEAPALCRRGPGLECGPDERAAQGPNGYTLAVALIRVRTAQALDDLAGDVPPPSAETPSSGQGGPGGLPPPAPGADGCARGATGPYRQRLAGQ